MFETIETILGVAVAGVVFLSTLVGFIASLAKSIKSKRLSDIAQATTEIAESASEKVVEAEKLFSQAANVLKAVGIKTGEIKKENVMTYIKSQCADKRIAFDEEYWSNRVEQLVNVLNANKDGKNE